uniref:DUF7153 domain-containing protein n=1 Tax=Timema bartmani TaxID=61472 RepID=A0A7R9F0Y9_9NEOP|nr:unnamed protein product [Timema bartmani]
MSLFLFSVLFPWVHFTEIQDSYRSLQLPKLLQEHQLSSGCILHQGLYREVRGIVPETELPMLTPHDHMSYILLGFKSMENNFNQVNKHYCGVATEERLEQSLQGSMAQTGKGGRNELEVENVMVDTWKDWSGARHIYMYLPDDLGLSRVTLFHRESPDTMSLFKYIVLVECRNVVTTQQQGQLLDFVQRLRVERITGYISLYTPGECVTQSRGQD